ncbi:uncharacterized protein LOC128387969 [Panonychus citri]|uniref:uncharacterized protein LOC128387969 n=1 Tax=Panonychus citri TaxID=50023 RepID=UPI0023070FBE|nr:uncharacterized protein LOC128387969 [Panonychus citri]
MNLNQLNVDNQNNQYEVNYNEIFIDCFVFHVTINKSPKCFNLICYYNYHQPSDGSAIKMPIGINLVIVIVVNDITLIVNYLVTNENGHRKLIVTQIDKQIQLSSSSSYFYLKSSTTLMTNKLFSSNYLNHNLMCPIILIIITASLVSASTSSSSSATPSSSSSSSSSPSIAMSTTTNGQPTGRRLRNQSTSSGLNIRLTQNNDLSSSSSSSSTSSSSSSSSSSSINQIISPQSINTFWLVAIIFNATLAGLFFLIFCYLCLKKSLQSRKIRLGDHYGDPFFTRKSMARNDHEFNGSHLKNEQPPGASSVYTIPMDKNLLSVDSNNNNLIRQQSALNKFKAAGRLTGHLVTSSSPIQSAKTLSTLDSFTESVPSSPAKYDPPPNRLQGPIDNLKSVVTDENIGRVVNFTGSNVDPTIVTQAAKSFYVDQMKEANNQLIINGQPTSSSSTTIKPEAMVSCNKIDGELIKSHHAHPAPPASSLSFSSTSSTTTTTTTTHLVGGGEMSTTKTPIESKNLIVDRIVNYVKPVNDEINCDTKDEGDDNQRQSKQHKHRSKKALAMVKDLQSIGSRVVTKLRQTSVSIQTSPTIWFGTVNVKNDPSIAWESHPIYSEPYSPNHDTRLERKYFIYLVSDANPYFRKNCIGKITLPTKSALTLSQLRDMLMKAEDSSLKDILKKNRSFRFLTETYRFVAQNEAIAPIDQVYPTQGIFIKLSAPDYSIMSKSTDHLTFENLDSFSTIKSSGSKSKRTYRDDAKFASFINISETNPDKISYKDHQSNSTIKQKRVTVNPQQIKREKVNKLYQNQESNSEQVSTSDPRKRCGQCNKPAIMGCGKCNHVFYCSIKCKNIHYSDHRSTCSSE